MGLARAGPSGEPPTAEADPVTGGLGPPRSPVLQPHLALGALGDLAATPSALPPRPRERKRGSHHLTPPRAASYHARILQSSRVGRPEKPVPPAAAVATVGSGSTSSLTARHFRGVIGSHAEVRLSGAMVPLSASKCG